MCKRSLPFSTFMGALFLVSTHLLLGADTPAAAVGASQTEPRQEVLRLEREWTIAENKHDEAMLRRILDEKFVASFGAKKPPYDKEGFIEAQLAGDVDPTVSATLSDQMVVVDGDTAVVVGTDTERSTKKGAAYTAVARYTATYIRRNGRWLALAEHMVIVPQAK